MKYILLQEGTGDNLLWEDIQNGFNDYLNYYIYDSYADMLSDYDDGCINDEKCIDGGMWLFNNITHPYNSVTELIKPFLKDNAFSKSDYLVIVVD